MTEQQTAWRPVEESAAPLIAATEGDGFEGLRQVRQKYYNKANKLAARISEDYYEGDLTNLREYITRLRECGDRVGALIPEDKHVVEVGSVEYVPRPTGDNPEPETVSEAESQPGNGTGAGSTATGVPQEGRAPAEQVGEGDPQRGVGYGIDYLGGTVQTGLGEITVEESKPGIPGASKDPINIGTSPDQTSGN